ncbi:glutamate dehydrogenase [Frankineae bacterium MT45]|nr:glutamate dehydrogenase [Frankineae bacterium MT45]
MTNDLDSDTLTKVFLRRYLAQAQTQLSNRDLAQLDDAAQQHLALGRVRPSEANLVSVTHLDGDTSAIDIVTDDAPYLVDSVRAELERLGYEVEAVLHPQLVVRRDEAGNLLEVFDLDDDAELPAGVITESWIHTEVEALSVEQESLIRAELQLALQDVHYAVDDAPETYALARSLADGLAADPGQFDRAASAEAGELLRWLVDGNCMIVGHAAYSANELASGGNPSEGELRGVLRGDTKLSPLEILPAFRSGAPLVIFKSPLVSRVRRSDRYDCITVVTAAQDGSGQTIHVFLGLIIDTGEEWMARVPVVRKRVGEIMRRSGVRPNSHTGRQLLAALRTLPRDELLAAPTADLLRLAELVMDRAEQDRVGVFARVHLNRDFVTVLVYFAADRLGPETRRKVAKTVMSYWPGTVISRDDRIVELGLARMQFLIALRPNVPTPQPDRQVVEAEVARLTRRWSDDLADLLTIAAGEERARTLLPQYSGAFPEAYKADFSASTAVTDVARLDELPPDDGLAFQLYTPAAGEQADRRLKIYRTGRPLSLARTLPILSQMGIEVLDERPYELNRPGSLKAWIYDFGFAVPHEVNLDAERAADVIDTLRSLWRGEIEQDGLNALVLRARMTWWQVNVLRAYVKYLRQAGIPFSQGYVVQALTDYPLIARMLVELFEVRFDPDREGLPHVSGTNGSTTPDDLDLTVDRPILDQINEALGDVASLDQDRILRSLLGLISATLRTNAFQHESSSALAIKLDPRRVAELPEPRPRYEIWVYSPRVEGVHLRFGAIARGGLRWSDRREDFRTEVLGLVKAQMVKNAVIVPVGAKGGFVCKQLPDPQTDREAWLAEGIACYRLFIRGMLDLTDNYAADGSGKVVVPEGVRRYDADDPYLVVAADKGTATFSDIANGIAIDYGFWLGDAFASGGSVGYDHKAMGITARGAWESVKFHFRELGVNTQTDDFTVVGIGDMSGDVFGNGMLLSEHIRLVAAFDHRHIFLDPNPVSATSFPERQRLFGLPRSSWGDYDRSLISEGGGVFPRTLKAIPISPEIRAALAIESDAATMTPQELIRAILTARVDLLFNGGVGTYVKASTEVNAAAGDKANDAVRIDGNQLRVQVVGEGGNLGFTQPGRIEFARNGGRINTDAIDNSAGVDTSDHEVNVKILLDRLVAAKSLPAAERNILLASATDAVAEHVLRDNYEQNVLLGIGRRNAARMISVHGRFINSMEASGQLDRALEFLPSEKELAARRVAGDGLTSPELAVLVAYAKMTLAERIDDSTLPDEPWFQRVLSGYFPPQILQRAAGGLQTHPLHREIITTCVVNDLVNRSGTTFVHRVVEETGADVAQIARAYTVVREIFGLEALWRDIEALDNVVPTAAQFAGYQETRRLIDRATRWFVDVRFPITDVASEVERFGPTIASLTPKVRGLLGSVEGANLEGEIQRLKDVGLPDEIALRTAELLTAFLLLDVVEIAVATDQPAEQVAALHFQASEMFRVDELLNMITALPREDRWSALARAALRYDVYAALSAITRGVLASTPASDPPADRLEQWRDGNVERVSRTLTTIGEALARDNVDLATLSVALRVMRSLPV